MRLICIIMNHDSNQRINHEIGRKWFEYAFGKGSRKRSHIFDALCFLDDIFAKPGSNTSFKRHPNLMEIKSRHLS